MRNVMLLSTSTVHGSPYMQYAMPFLRDFLGEVRSVLFVPYARPSGMTHARYTELFRERLQPAGFDVQGIDETADARAAVQAAESVFVGGGNTFVLLRALWDNDLIAPLRRRVAAGMPYMGSSAGSNVAGLTIGTTNDMPIVQPSTFEALQLVPFNINPHYLDPDPGSTHMGETRQTRIDEFHCFNPQPVLGLREGALVQVRGNAATLLGNRGARLFRAGVPAEELQTGADLSELLA